MVIPKWAYRTFIPTKAIDLHRILSNLGENAIHAAGHRGRRIVISFERVSGRVQVVIRDFGNGFSDQALAAFQKGEVFTTKTEGTGRGLLSARDLVSAAKGTLQILSDQTGAVATVELPVCEAPEWYFDVSANQLDAVFVLDDDEEIASKLARALPQTKITSFSEETEFLQAARANPGIFLFVDYGYAGRRTGLDLIRAEGLADRAVLFTGRAHFDGDIQARAMAAGIRILPKECVILRGNGRDSTPDKRSLTGPLAVEQFHHEAQTSPATVSAQSLFQSQQESHQ
ncbi:ATP-binding protein [Bdellovibrionota bacterium FG-1]